MGAAVVIYVGCDPGWSGGIVALTGRGRVLCTVKGYRTFSDLVQTWNRSWREVFGTRTPQEVGVFVYLEKVGGIPKQSAMGAFSFGRAYMAVEALFYGKRIRCLEIDPQEWERNLRIIRPARATQSKGRKLSQKQVRRERARRRRELEQRKRECCLKLFPGNPELAKHSGLRDAALIAECLRQRLRRQGGEQPEVPTQVQGPVETCPEPVGAGG